MPCRPPDFTVLPRDGVVETPGRQGAARARWQSRPPSRLKNARLREGVAARAVRVRLPRCALCPRRKCAYRFARAARRRHRLPPLPTRRTPRRRAAHVRR